MVDEENWKWINHLSWKDKIINFNCIGGYYSPIKIFNIFCEFFLHQPSEGYQAHILYPNKHCCFSTWILYQHKKRKKVLVTVAKSFPLNTLFLVVKWVFPIGIFLRFFFSYKIPQFFIFSFSFLHIVERMLALFYSMHFKKSATKGVLLSRTKSFFFFFEKRSILVGWENNESNLA